MKFKSRQSKDNYRIFNANRAFYKRKNYIGRIKHNRVAGYLRNAFGGKVT